MGKLLIFSIMLLLITACMDMKDMNKISISSTEFMLDTVITITLNVYEDAQILDEAFAIINDMESRYSHKITESLPDLLKRNAAQSFTPLNAEDKTLLENSIYYSYITNGAFDITVGPLVSLWNISGGGHYPKSDELEEILPLVDYKAIILEDDRAMLANKGMEINFGAIAKGFIGDRVANMLRSKGVESSILDLGGDIMLIGNKTDGSDFNIGIKDPLEVDGSYFAVINLSDKAIVTSGNYQRNFTYNGKNYHHIIDPKTGFPTDNELIQVTIISNTLTEADALSTGTFILGLNDGLELIESIEGVEAIFVTQEKSVYITSGISEELKITNDSYTIFTFEY